MELYFKYIHCYCYDCMKTIVETTNPPNYNPINISDMYFEGKPPNLMTIKFSCYTVRICISVNDIVWKIRKAQVHR